LTILARRIEGGVEVSQPSEQIGTLVSGPSSRLLFARTIIRFLWGRRTEFDFVLVQGYALAALVSNLCGLALRIPTAMLVCSPTEVYYQLRRTHPQGGKPYRALEACGIRVLARINAIVGKHYFVLSQYLADTVRGHGFRKAIEIIPVYGVDIARFRPSTQTKPEVKAALRLPTTGALIFFSSRIAPEKDSETLLAAFQRLAQSGRDVWLLHRSGGHQQFLEEAARFGIADRVIAGDAVHPVLELPQYYQASDVCVQASRAEGLGFSPLEALACGAPVVATATGGLRETITDNQSGWTYSTGDIQGLTHCLEAVLDNPSEAQRRATIGRNLVREKFETNFVFDELMRHVRSLVEESPLSRAASRMQLQQ
jgi:glycosyltransferase involved in cell wall biosynthesis